MPDEIYIKSTYTGQIHKTDFIPKYGGWELARKEDYEEQQRKFELEGKALWDFRCQC